MICVHSTASPRLKMMPARMRPRPKMRHLPVKWRSHLRAMPLLTSSVFVMARQHEARARARLRPCDARAPPCSRSGEQFGAPARPSAQARCEQQKRSFVDLEQTGLGTRGSSRAFEVRSRVHLSRFRARHGARPIGRWAPSASLRGSVGVLLLGGFGRGRGRRIRQTVHRAGAA